MAMQEKRSFYLLLIIMGAVAIATMAAANFILYRVAFQEKSQSLVETAQSQARLIEAMARFNRRTNRVDWETPVGERGPTSLLSERAAADTIGQLRDAHQNYIGFGQTGEFVIAGIEDQQIVFLLSHRHDSNNEPAPIPLYSDVAEPTRRALMVQSGVMVGKDYRGVEVLAAYEPVDVLNFGIVAKVDMAEIRAPFIRAVSYTSIVSLLVIFAGSLLFRRITNPIIDKIIKSEHQYRALVEDIAEWVWETDQHAVVTFSSQVITDLLGYDKDELLNKPFTQIIDDTAQQALKQLLTGMGEKVTLNNIQTRALNKQGEVVYIELNATPIHHSDGRFLGYRGVARDITSRIQAEKLRREYQHNLETQVKERTQALHDMNDELKNFTYIVSHDLRSPLVSIMGFCSELKEDITHLQRAMSDSEQTQYPLNLLDDSIPESLRYIDKATEKMESLINSILALSRLGVRELHYTDVKLDEVVDLNLKALAYQLDGVDVMVHPLPTIYSDETSLTQIFGNLLGNAVKYLRPEIQGRIEIGCESLSDHWKLCIRDNGRGVADTDLPYIFDLFKRVGEQKVQGEGVGLTYVLTMIRRLEGRIECHSTLGEGTQFTIYLPKNNETESSALMV
jgi:PAS domain S-box-containing protein